MQFLDNVKFFEKNWDDFTDDEKTFYNPYCHKIKISRCLDRVYDEADKVLNFLPKNLFEDENFMMDKSVLAKLIRQNFKNYDDLDIQSNCDLIFDALYPVERSSDINLDALYTPEFTRETACLTVSRTNSEFYPFPYIFKRDCYETLYNSVVESIRKTPVAVIGGPGIGKSSFLKYIFAKEVNLKSQNCKML